MNLRTRRRSHARLLAVLIASLSIAGAGVSSSATAEPGSAGAGTAAAPRAVVVSSNRLLFGGRRLGTLRVKSVTLRNTGSSAITVSSLKFSGSSARDFRAGSSCISGRKPTKLAAGATCRIAILFTPRALGKRSAVLRIADSTASSPHSISLSGAGTEGYYIVGSRGGVAAFGDAVHRGQIQRRLSAPIISLAVTSSGNGYWLLGRDGGIFTFGDARFFGSTGAMQLNQPVVAMAAKPASVIHDNSGYWLVARDGGIFSFGGAPFFGSTGGMRLNRPVVGMVPTPSGNGYWLVASDGGIFTFGDAKFLGSTGGTQLQQPIVGMAATPSGKGYWLVAKDGGIFAFGDAKFSGSASGFNLGPVVGMAAAPNGQGYWVLTSFAAIFKFGGAAYYGDNFTRVVPYRTAIAASMPLLRTAGSQTVFELPRLTSASANLMPLIEPHLPQR